MRILFDHGAPDRLMSFLPGHEITRARQLGWDTIPDGEMLNLLEQRGFDLLVTTDKNMIDQQNFKDRQIAVVVLENSRWTVAQRYVRRIAVAVNSARPGSYTVIRMPKY